MVQVELSRIIINERSEHQVIVLKETDGPRAFPILIGIYEATAIDRGIKEYRPPRPLTHDLVGQILRSLDARLDRVIISDLRSGTFYAKLILVHNGRSIEVDSRPSDAIALAVQTGADIFAEEKVIEEVIKGQEGLELPSEGLIEPEEDEDDAEDEDENEPDEPGGELT